MSKTLIKGFKPVITLTGFDPTEVINKYNLGEYNDLSLEQIRKVTIQDNINVVSENDDSSRYVVIDNRGIRSNMITANYRHIKRCQWCRQDLKAKPIGIPIKSIYRDGVLNFKSEGCYCTFECAYADLIHSFHNNPSYHHSESYLKYSFNELYPNDRLFPAPDWKLHEENGGSLTEEQYRSKEGNHTYHDSTRLKQIPVSRQYFIR